MGAYESKPKPGEEVYNNLDTDYSLYQIETCKPAYEVMIKLFEYKESLKKIQTKYDFFLKKNINSESKKNYQRQIDQNKITLTKLESLERELDTLIYFCKNGPLDPAFLTSILDKLNEFKRISPLNISLPDMHYLHKRDKYQEKLEKLKNLSQYNTYNTLRK